MIIAAVILLVVVLFIAVQAWQFFFFYSLERRLTRLEIVVTSIAPMKNEIGFGANNES